MRVAKRVSTGQRGETRLAEADISGTETFEHAPRKMTFAENVVLTIKVLAGFGLLGAALWGIRLWTSAR
jgi:hypothetical protein